MQIRPSNQLLHALSQQAENVANPALRKAPANEAARAAARAVFAQINSPGAVSGQVPARAVQAQAPTQAFQVPAVQSTMPALPATPPDRPMPRGSLLNILV